MAGPDNATLPTVLQAFVKAGLANVYTTIPATIITYDPVEQRASCRPVVRGRQHVPALDTVEPDAVPPPIIPNVPVIWPGGARGAVTIPLLPGEPCTLLFAHRSTDEWRQTGLADVVPQDARRHDLADAICLPGGRSFTSTNPVTGPLSSAQVDAANIAVVVHALTKLQLGSTAATEKVLLGDAFEADLLTWVTALGTWLTAFSAWLAALALGVPSGGLFEVMRDAPVATALGWVLLVKAKAIATVTATITFKTATTTFTTATTTFTTTVSGGSHLSSKVFTD